MSRTPRFFVETIPDAPGARLSLEGEEGHHAVHVLRLEEGDPVEVFDGKGGCGAFVVVGRARDGVGLELRERRDEDREPGVSIILAVAAPKPKRLLGLVEKVTELGVARFVPLLARRSRPGPIKRERLRRRAIEAAKQCGRNRLPEIAKPVDVDELVREHRPGVELALVGEAAGLAPPVRTILGAARPRSLLVAVGPEGGFTPEEKERLAANGFAAVSLGRTTLRVETAALALLACAVYEA